MSNDNSPVPDVSVVIATRNRAQWLPRLLRSVQQQDLTSLEVLVIDDGSDEACLAEYRQIWAGLDDRFRLHLQPAPGIPGTGPSCARNRGLRLARGRYVAFCDDDDYWKGPDHLSAAVEALDRLDADLCFSNLEGELDGRVTMPDWYAEVHDILLRRRIDGPGELYELSLESFCRSFCRRHVPLDTCVIRHSVLARSGLFWESVRYNEDADFLLRAVDECRRFLYRPKVTAVTMLTPHERAYSAVNSMERNLIYASTMQHVQAMTTKRPVIRAARSMESWALSQVAAEGCAAGRTVAARWFAFRSFLLSPSLGSLKRMLRIFVLAR